MLKTSISMLIVCGLVSLASANGTPLIDVGVHSLLPDQAGQTVEIFVTGGVLVQGLEFNVQIGDATSGPVFEGVDILTGTIFGPSNDGIFPGSYITPRVAYQGTTTVQTRDIGYGAGYVSTSGLLATLTIDTTGISGGNYDLLLIGTQEGNTNFAGVLAEVTNGSLSVIPEPLSLSLMLVGSGLLLRRRSRRTR